MRPPPLAAGFWTRVSVRFESFQSYEPRLKKSNVALGSSPRFARDRDR